MTCRSCGNPMSLAENGAYQDRCELCWVKANTQGSNSTDRRQHAYVLASEFSTETVRLFEAIFKK